MPAFSSTLLQKCYKEEATSIFARLSGTGAGTAPSIVSTGGLSKGVKLVTRNSDGDYTLYLEDSLPVQTFLGSVLVATPEYTGAAPTVLAVRVHTADPSTRSIRFVCLDSAGAAKVLASGEFLNITITYTPSSVY